ncbi:nucleolar protein dao-5 isoform X2 [Gambusia affinis]|uniref:nucleolar protein dao-5 isoform X2 n=1 Tax=Gambusia affinis TaxID=33528 RepID=UPI001CDBC0C9|nr:nucleolar protein dao-5 isoform X2 [Gambusia affinis]
MKPDGATMESPELGEAAVVVERSSQENINDEAQIHPEAAAPAETQKANGKPLAVDPKVKPKAAGSKIQPTSCAGAAGSSSRLGTASHRTERDIKSSSAGRKAAAAGGVAASKPSAAGAVPKRPVGVPAISFTAKNQSRALDRKPVGPVKTADATVTNGTKLRVAPNGINRKPAAEAANGARPKTTAATNRPVASAAPKTSASTATKPADPASSRTRPAAGPSTSRATSTFSKPAAAATTKISTTATSRVASSRATAAPSAGRSAGAQLNKNPANKDVSRPPSAAVAKKPLTTQSASPVAKKKETSKTTTAVKPTSAPTATKAADPKASLGKVQSVVKPTQMKKPAATARFPQSTRPPLGRTPPCSPAGRPLTPAAKRGTNKPTQTVSPFTQKAAKVALPVAEPQIAAPSTTAAESVQVADTVTEVTTAAVVSAVEEVQTQQGRDAEPEEVAQPINTTSPPTSPPFQEQSEDRAAPLPEPEKLSSPAKPSSPTVASSSARLPQEADQTASTPDVNPTEPSTAAQTEVAIINLNEEEDEEEREGSQLVSVSEMSGTTQPTEESRPGSGGPVSRAAWKAGGALLSELDSEDVSGSQQGASELSAPGVLEGTESTDDLGDGSLKGAIDMELASVGSPDFEKVPDIPANEFEDEDEDDSDRVCDMEVGSERIDEPRRPRHDNDVDEDEDDDDVEMASEGVTESGLESYGNADEDDFAEDNLDNLNRVLQPLPPPPVLPSAPAAQWDQPNPFASPWEEPPQSHIPEESKASANCEALAQSAAQTWLDVGSAPSALERQDVCHHSSVPNEPPNLEPVGPASETALPGDQGDQKQEGKLPANIFEALAHSSQPDGDCQDAQVERGEQEEEEEEAEPETLPADEVLGGPSTAPTSNPSSSSVTEDEASDTEGEAQLDESLKCPLVSNLTFDMQPPLPQRCLSTVEEGEEVESFIADEATPPSAASLASYNFDSVTTASNSNSNAQSTGESCIKSPGIFSLEELPEEAKEPGLNLEPDAQCRAAEYIECGKQQEAEAAERVETELPGSEDATVKTEEIAEDIQPPYYSTVCEKTEDSFAGFAAIPHPHRRDHSSYPRTFCDLVKPVISAAASPKLTCTDLPPRSLGQQALSPQLRRLEQHQRQLLELQQRRAQQSRPLEEAEQERKRRVEEEQRKKKDEAEEEIKRNKADEERRKKEEEELQQRRGLELQLQQQQQELQQRQQIMQWQQELQQSNKSQTALLSPSSGLCTIYEALESSEDEETPEQNPDPDPTLPRPDPHQQMCPSCDSDRPSPERPPPLDLDWEKKKLERTRTHHGATRSSSHASSREVTTGRCCSSTLDTGYDRTELTGSVPHPMKGETV